jgi:cysteine desulfurase
MTRQVYLDFQATTPCDPRVVDAMLPYFTEHFGNAHSKTHAFGWRAEEAVEQAREQVAELIGAGPREIVFTSGATESNNLAIKGVARAYRERRNHIVSVATEHRSVLDVVRGLEREGFAVTLLPVRADGLLDLDRLAAAVGERTILVSVMAVNNEIGVIQPLAEIAAIAHGKGALFHTDAAQATGKIPLDVVAMGIDLLSVSGHKIYAPKGIGALYVRKRPRIRLMPLFDGGGHERGFRSGTLPTPLCVGLGEGCRIAGAGMEGENQRLRGLAERFLAALSTHLTEFRLNGDMVHRVAGNLNISFPFVEGEALVRALRDIAVSTGSACSSAEVEPSHVLRALGLDSELAHASLRIGFGRATTEAEVDFAASYLADTVLRLREDSPLWALHREGIELPVV